ncbi:5-oxoprolinase subunit C family protein [Mongoliitalea daihaiensis]|uniref:5-oxoprolinase subunit C family protein n=1 Tax=Mongoliitalea daihaiensis TaxID=2782006 RepID=UPI001F19FF4A|nr:biotin-dependent carboxyltransferase family protein [Mongoliitalea daihaiensis]UJP64108.1 biotin-dependent carboxyltransferase family protein [Mongoliitalea daihaiensis]
MNGDMNKLLGKVEVLQAGLLCSIQDMGRKGFAFWGVPYSGAMDSFSYELANRLLGNQPDAACLEIGPAPITLKFHAPTLIVVTGSLASLSIDEKSILPYKPYAINAGAEFRVRQHKEGNWIYLAVKDGFQTPNYLHSRSWSKGISPIIQLSKGDLLPFQTPSSLSEIFRPTATLKHPPVLPDLQVIQAYRGSDWQLLPTSIQESIQKNTFKLSSRQDRMGYELLGLPSHSLPQLLTAPVFPGTIQLTPSGSMIALMREAQVTGGYPRILQLTEESINQLSQKRVGSLIQFELIDF